LSVKDSTLAARVAVRVKAGEVTSSELSPRVTVETTAEAPGAVVVRVQVPRRLPASGPVELPPVPVEVLPLPVDAPPLPVGPQALESVAQRPHTHKARFIISSYLS
jgi:hypothetical protein